MLALLLLVPLVSSQLSAPEPPMIWTDPIEAASLPASDLQTFSEQLAFDGNVLRGMADVYAFSLLKHTIDYVIFDLKVYSGDSDLVAGTLIAGQVVTWQSNRVGNDQIVIRRSDPKMRGRNFVRDFEVAVIGFTDSRYTLTIAVGSGQPINLSTDMVQRYMTTKTFAEVMDVIMPEDAGLGTVGWCLLSSATTVLVVIGVWLGYQRTKKTGPHDGYDHFITI